MFVFKYFAKVLEVCKCFQIHRACLVIIKLQFKILLYGILRSQVIVMCELPINSELMAIGKPN